MMRSDPAHLEPSRTAPRLGIQEGTLVVCDVVVAELRGRVVDSLPEGRWET